MDAWLKIYEESISSGEWSQISKIAILDLVFGSDVQFYKGNSAIQKLSTMLGGIIKIKVPEDSAFLNFASVNRRVCPFWHWVAANIFEETVLLRLA